MRKANAAKERAEKILPRRSEHFLYVDHAKGKGSKLFSLPCELNLEGVIAKKAESPYDPASAQPYWIKTLPIARRRDEATGSIINAA
jgi:ATP-dependent DNA ligase